MSIPVPDLLVCPITAVAYSPVESPVPLVFVAEGRALKVYEQTQFQQRWFSQVFLIQSIHGIGLDLYPQGGAFRHHLCCIIWGGRSVRILNIRFHSSTATNKICFEFLGDELCIDDRILHAALTPLHVRTEGAQALTTVACLITAHNETYLVSRDSSHGIPILSSRFHSSGSIIALYSAYSQWEMDGDLTVVAGTVFGEVHVWRTKIDTQNFQPNPSSSIALLGILKGHEGSVYGVRISSPDSNTDLAMVASCSDDRTVRAWKIATDVMDTPQQGLENDGIPDLKLSTTTGFQTRDMDSTTANEAAEYPSSHLSRIWSTALLDLPSDNTLALSSGEDGAVFAWVTADKKRHLRPGSEVPLLPIASFKRHMGRNIWSMDQRLGSSDAYQDAISIVTGGADGRVIHQSLSFPLSREVHRNRLLPCYEPFDATDTIGSFIARFHKSNDTPNAELERFSSFAFVGQDQILASSRFGHILSGRIMKRMSDSDAPENAIDTHENVVIWQTCDHIPELKAPIIIARVPIYGAVLIGKSGELFAWKSQNSTIFSLARMPRSVSILLPLETRTSDSGVYTALVGYHGGTEAHVIKWHQDSKKLGETPLRIEIPDGFKITAATWIQGHDILALGSRNGRILLNKITVASSSNETNYAFTTSFLHEGNAITQLLDLGKYLDPNDLPVYLLSVGRDGTVQVFSFDCALASGNHIDFQKVHKVKLPLGPSIEGACVDHKSKEILVWGFRGTDFVVWNCNNQTDVMTVHCGGGHRNWNFKINSDSRIGGSFIWTKASSTLVRIQDQPTQTVIQQGLHGREIKAIAVHSNKSSSNQILVATGSEDTTIRIAGYSDKFAANPHGSFALRTNCIVPHHTTGICHLQWSEDGKYLFSSSGEEQLIVWRVQAVPFVKVGIVLVAECPQVSEAGDLRIMNFSICTPANYDATQRFLIAAAYSDSTVRIWIVDCAGQQIGTFRLVAIGTYASNCLTQIHYLRLRSRLFLLTTSTDGHIAIWDLPSDISQQDALSVAGPATLVTRETHLVHQSSIKSLKLLSPRCSLETILIATGGDDNAIALTSVVYHEGALTFNTTVLPKAHAAAVTGLIWIHDKDLDTIPPARQDNSSETDRHLLISASNDQTLRSWEVLVHFGSLLHRSVEEHNLQVRKLQKCQSDIADISNIDQMSHTDGNKIVVAGVGIEVWDAETLASGEAV